MKQILQNLGNGETLLADVPCPHRGAGRILVRTTRSLVSLGTEKMLIEFGKSGWISKARSQPDKVRQVLQKIRTDGLFTTLDAVRSKLDTPITLGYCNVGEVVEADDDSGFHPGDRIISNGPHAEMVVVPENLAARIPDAVSDDQAAFAVVAAIGLQGIRLLEPTLGERFVVSGLGLIGLLAVQMLRAHGCHVLGSDFDQRKLELARQFGAETVDLSAGQDPVAVALEWTRGTGVDGVLITASSRSHEIVHQAATMCRKRGRIVLVGVTGLNLQRADFYEKELTFQVSCSYGPGRYDDAYEQKGLDYPIGFVRWTEQRNFQAVLELMAQGKLETMPLVSHRFAFDRALEGYEAVGNEAALGILLEYPRVEQDRDARPARTIPAPGRVPAAGPGDTGIAFIGAGSFTTRMLLPLLPRTGVARRTIVSSSGVSAAHAAKKFGFAQASSDSREVLRDNSVQAVFITTPHNSHARLVCDALAAGKHVFVEKPLALQDDELEEVRRASAARPELCLMVGFNCAGSPVVGCQVMPMTGGEGRLGDCVSIQLAFANGSLATVHYLANGNKDFPKERIEVFAGGTVLACDNFRVSREFGGGRRFRTRGQDKGHAAGLRSFLETVARGGTWPIPADELFEVSKITLEADRQARMGLAGTAAQG
jgi:threonine dehydrogenase-like Zn-dependent dehydrogenase/predicted dehydrogenase